ncbi:hypothetical protein ANCDUO_20422 [Ancylostoma duodenale]|uniref:Uncharacterized protein n=1 Tax=Ancylostoma duodenale TaxID=51022 RepID=A0A0C2BZW2_9BILA|nr:hypothetical protein ANCDUO_20422 [Ancylostoma duodenale]
MASTSKESYGIASYVISRHRKNKVFIWQSKKDHGRVYEFLVSSRFRRQNVKDLKVPLVLIDNDVIRENPDEPLNARHFCKGKDLVDAVLKRTKLQFYEECSTSDDTPEISVDKFAETVLESGAVFWLVGFL